MPGAPDVAGETRDPVGEAIADWAAAREAAGEGLETPGAAEDAATGRDLEGVGAPPLSVRDGAVVELREITKETVRAVCRLVVAPPQRGFVAPNAVSLAEALFEKKAWYRAIVADGVPVGFVMLYDDPEAAEYFLWRLMVDHRSQGLGYGRRAMELLIDHVRGRPGATALLTSWVPGVGSPEPFYRAIGFVPTGEIDEDEIVARLTL